METILRGWLGLLLQIFGTLLAWASLPFMVLGVIIQHTGFWLHDTGLEWER